MATINGVVQFTGKLGEVVGQKGQGGKNYMRVRRRDIKNPRSDKQNIQRMILATVGTSIGFLAEVLRTSVEGKQAGAQTLAYLRSLWMRQLRTADILSGNGFNYLSKGENRFAPNPFVLSKGSLGTYSISEIGDGASSFKVSGMPAAFDASLTASQLFPNVTLGNQITLICVGDTTDGSSVVEFCRFAFKTDDMPALLEAGQDGFILNPAAIDLTKAAGAWDQLAFHADGSIWTAPDGVTNPDGRDFLAADLCAAGIIVSNLNDNKRSNSSLYVATSYRGTWNPATTAYPTYGDEGVSIDMASDVYLNNSTTVVDSTAEEIHVVSALFNNVPISPVSGRYQIVNPAEDSVLTLSLSRPLNDHDIEDGLSLNGAVVTCIPVEGAATLSCNIRGNGISFVVFDSTGVNLAVIEVSGMQ